MEVASFPARELVCIPDGVDWVEFYKGIKVNLIFLVLIE